MHSELVPALEFIVAELSKTKAPDEPDAAAVAASSGAVSLPLLAGATAEPTQPVAKAPGCVLAP